MATGAAVTARGGPVLADPRIVGASPVRRAEVQGIMVDGNDKDLHVRLIDDRRFEAEP